MDLAQIAQTLAVYAIPVLLAITGHEAAHAYAARWLGDPTAHLLGRATLNPLRHIDPVGTVALPLGLYLVTSGAFLFGYAKPVPVVAARLRNPRWGMAGVAIAGPAANFIMGLCWMLGLLLVAAIGLRTPGLNPTLLQFGLETARAGVVANMALMAFNLLPLPPLDGGRVLMAVLPPPLAQRIEPFERWGFAIVLALVFTGLLGRWWMLPIMKTGSKALSILLSPLSFLVQ